MPAALVQWLFTYYYWVCCYTLSCLILTHSNVLQMSSTCALCIIELVLKIIACTLFVFIEVDITAWGGGGGGEGGVIL